MLVSDDNWILFFIFTYFCILVPLNYNQGGLQRFSDDVRKQATMIQPWRNWKIVLLNAENKLVIHLKPETQAVILSTPKKECIALSPEALIQLWPMVLKKHPHTIYITQERYISKLQPNLGSCQLIFERPTLFFSKNKKDAAVALIPIR